MAISGFTCKTVTTFSGYRQLGTRTLPASLSPVRARTTGGRRIGGKIVAAQYADVIVVAGSDRIDTDGEPADRARRRVTRPSSGGCAAPGRLARPVRRGAGRRRPRARPHHPRRDRARGSWRRCEDADPSASIR